MLVCSGPHRRDANHKSSTVLHVEWMHTEPGGNSGCFWSGPNRQAALPERRSAAGTGWPTYEGRAPVLVHGELFGVGLADPDNPGAAQHVRRKPMQGRGEWAPDVVADGVLSRWQSPTAQPHDAEEGLYFHGIGRSEDLFPQYPDHGIAARRDLAGAVGSRARIEYGGWGSTEREHRHEPAETVATAVGIGGPENTRVNSSNRSIHLRAHRAHPKPAIGIGT